MIRPAYAAWLSKSGNFDPAQRADFAQAAAKMGLRAYDIGRGILVACSDDLDGSSPVILGTIARRGSGTAVSSQTVQTALDESDVATQLVRDWWGDYVAIGRFGPKAAAGVLRAPFGHLATYHSERDDHVIVASAPSLLQSFGMSRPSVDWRALARHLIATELRTGATCLAGIKELTGGQMLWIAQSAARMRQCWSPWGWAERDQQHRNREAAAQGLGAAVAQAVCCRVPRETGSVLLLSGGLDSSILATTLSGHDRSFVGMTMTSPDALGDERAYARATASHVEAKLIEVARDARLIDLMRPLAPGLPLPTGAQFRMATLVPAGRIAEKHGAVMIVDGGGGDNMFCSLQSATPVVDQLLTHGPSRGALGTAASIARMANVSVLDVLRQAAGRIYDGRRAYRWPVDLTLLNPDLISGAGRAHPWLETPPNGLPGKAAQVALLLAASAVGDALDDARWPSVVSPLVAQPVAEAALRVPTWMWFEDGRNRAVVRRAFTDRLPASVINRRSKGTPANFMAELVADRVDELRAFLLDGLLAQNHVLDKQATEAALTGGPTRDLGFARVLQLVNTEAWARSWQ